ncbi:hypothetical protein [Methylobacterium nonmethylotrophicum]|uniref:Uncharacterized protein n=1 Tax=Methylobacterium nonmethylotrophicum TaxID=1141884 RepID=A0A4Z0NX81_9HYPH|nr:hypothetical protein [Methylobacterium nonmethylotrophicum]TGE02548.1 hypothetical protein EU555_01930 [Methylobacterium nonmethylotrophicum]
MTTLSASGTATQPLGSPPVNAPKSGAHKQRLLDRISAQQQSGALSDTDAGALASAVQDIDQAMQGASGSGGGNRLDPSQARSRMDDLIGAEVDKGTLTSGQATTLKSLLSSHKPSGPGDPEGAGGPPPADAAEGTAATADTSSATAASASDLLSSFLKQLQDAQSLTQASGYGATGSGVAATTSQAAVFDFRV